MIWLTSISSLVFLGAGIWLAIWVARLKNGELKLVQELNDINVKLSAQRSLMYTTKNRLDTTMAQLEALRIRHAKLLDKVHDGSLCDAGGIADELRGMLSNDP